MIWFRGSWLFFLLIRILYSRFHFYPVSEIYTSEKSGNDDAGDGSQDNPFKTVLKAMRFLSVEPFPPIFVDSKTEGEVRLRSLLFASR